MSKLDNIAYWVDFNKLNNRPKFKLLLVKNDKEMQVLNNKALSNKEEKAQAYKINDDYYLAHLKNKQI